MAKKRKISKAAGAAAETQTQRLIGAATAKVDRLVDRAARTANISKRRTYIIAALAALVVAGQAAARMRGAMSRRPAATAAQRQAVRRRK